jgi:hypothetical protein
MSKASIYFLSACISVMSFDVARDVADALNFTRANFGNWRTVVVVTIGVGVFWLLSTILERKLAK